MHGYCGVLGDLNAPTRKDGSVVVPREAGEIEVAQQSQTAQAYSSGSKIKHQTQFLIWWAHKHTCAGAPEMPGDSHTA